MDHAHSLWGRRMTDHGARSDHDRLILIEGVVTSMHQNLFGNGQPGALKDIASSIERVSGRVSNLENWRWWVLGIVAGAGGMIGWAIKGIVDK